MRAGMGIKGERCRVDDNEQYYTFSEVIPVGRYQRPMGAAENDIMCPAPTGAAPRGGSRGGHRSSKQRQL